MKIWGFLHTWFEMMPLLSVLACVSHSISYFSLEHCVMGFLTIYIVKYFATIEHKIEIKLHCVHCYLINSNTWNFTRWFFQFGRLNGTLHLSWVAKQVPIFSVSILFYSKLWCHDEYFGSVPVNQCTSTEHSQEKKRQQSTACKTRRINVIISLACVKGTLSRWSEC